MRYLILGFCVVTPPDPEVSCAGSRQHPQALSQAVG
jgi:hypothetical protein